MLLYSAAHRQAMNVQRSAIASLRASHSWFAGPFEPIILSQTPPQLSVTLAKALMLAHVQGKGSGHPCHESIQAVTICT